MTIAVKAGPAPEAVDAPLQAPARERLVLNVGCGPRNPEKLHGWFRGEAWREVRLDIDPGVRPDIVASAVDLSAIRDASFDAVWSSHVIEHFFEHEARLALREIVRVLGPAGFFLVTVPDVVGVARRIAEGGLEEVLYTSPAGPVAPVDVLYGLRSAVEKGNAFMAHRTCFSAERLGRFLVEAGFAEAHVWEGQGYALWGVGLMPDADVSALQIPSA